ncbi:alkaline shock response membrane anchor protein AmaP [Actinomycetospora termitidis]|uniref:Alkaline shock response membrane anchor protein AmaP n=1 Tax=Actinomycetospora termitidis TaxID=3053470 RepID=A0ABT7M7F5_9PSEU|nr:alkaline shock response membrane anchor protein AmaP [Actinomycetospora sp. Odt1-22]MDL5156608.1 alkaline shock response membrane anchor protein AmaP [Actinomycetospora sp. Odt1-22]
MSRRSRRAVARSTAADRARVLLTGLVLLALGVLVVLLGYGVFGSNRAQRPVVDPVVSDWIAGNADLTRWIAIVGGIVLLVVGLTWAVRSLRPEPRPDVLLSEVPGQRLTVEHSAIADAVRADAELIDGVSRARVRMVGTERRPALRMAVWLVEGTDVRDVWAEIDGRVLARARQAFAVDALPTAVRIELDAAASHAPRVQ